MSRVGKLPIVIPNGVKLQLTGQKVHVEGPKGKLDFTAHPRVKLEMRDSEVVVSRPTNQNRDRALHGLTRSLVFNMVKGVAEGFSKQLEIEGIGFRAQIKGKTLELALGFSHPVVFSIPEGVAVTAPKPTILNISGCDKALVGQVAANIRDFYRPEPYKGKGIRYQGEVIRRKQGKTAGK